MGGEKIEECLFKEKIDYTRDREEEKKEYSTIQDDL